MDGHTCQYCNRELNEEECEIIDNLSDIESNLSKETLSSLVYIVGYVQKGSNDIDDTTYYYEKYGNYLNALNRGCLTVPSDNCVQWTIFSYILFTQLSGKFCRTFLIKQFQSLAIKHNLEIAQHRKILADIFTKNHSLLKTPRSKKESSQKVLKLT